MNSLVGYGSGSSSGSDSEEEKPKSKVKSSSTKQGQEVNPDGEGKVTIEDNLHLKPVGGPSGSGMADFSKKMELVVANAAPAVQPNEKMDNRRHLDPSVKEVKYNPKYEDLYAPEVGPANPFKTEQQKGPKNTVTGHIEPAHLNDFQFELQRKTFHSYGFAQDPSVNMTGTESAEGTEKIVMGENIDAEASKSGLSVFEDTKVRPKDKRKRHVNKDASDIEGYLGPWGGFEDESRSAKPSEEDAGYLEEYLAKMKKRAKKQTDDKPIEEKSQLHIKDPYDYQGRSFLHIPQDTGINLKREEPPEKCFIPKRQIHTWTGHTKGVAVIQWFPRSGHLLLSGGMDNKVKLWETYKDRRCVRTYTGHKMAVKDVDFNRAGDRFLSTSYDRFIKLWDTETGECINRFTSNKVGHCVRFNPDEDKQDLFVVGTADKKIVCWDIRSNEIVQEYDRHLGAVNTITFVDDNRRFVTTSDDKSMRVWEWDIPVDMKYIADPGMHSMPAVARAPNQKWLACQSLDNKICIFSAGEKFREIRKKTFKGHMVAGYACRPCFSPEMSYLASGDGDGKVSIWDWKTTRMLARWKAHDRTCIQVLWHPHETSKLATASWDGTIKYWD